MTNRKSQKPPRQNDELLKGAFEENFPDFLRFLYPDADDIFDFSQAIQFMDKELLSIVPDRERKQGKRVADLLAKVFLKDGSTNYILLNTEIEGGSDKEFAKRIYQYNYRIFDRYAISVATIAVYTGDVGQSSPSAYHSQVLDTSLNFKYRTYHIFDHREDELLAMNNIFGLVVLACQKSLLEGKVTDIELEKDRLTIAKALLSHNNYSRDRIISFLVFLKNFLYINDSKINSNFDKELIQLSGGTIDMGVIEIVKKQERQLGMQQGRLEERAKAEAEKLAEKLKSALEFKRMGLRVEDIAKGLGLTVEQVEKLK